MKRIFINESHIRQLVKETLENLILGEDGMNDTEGLKTSLDYYMSIINNPLQKPDYWEIEEDETEYTHYDGTIKIYFVGFYGLIRILFIFAWIYPYFT